MEDVKAILIGIIMFPIVAIGYILYTIVVTLFFEDRDK